MSKAKKWIDPQEVEITNLMHKAYVAAEVTGETQSEQGKAIQALLEQLWLIKQGLTNSPLADKQWALDELHKNQRQFDPDDVSLAGARKAINKLAAGDYSGAVHTAQASIEHRETIRQDTKAKVGAAGRNTRIKNTSTRRSEIIEDYLKNKSQFRKKDQAYQHYADLYDIGWTTVRSYLNGL